MLDTLFSSRVRVKLLELFVANPVTKYHSRELARLTEERQNAVWRELKNLEEAGLLHSETHANRKEYVLAKEHPLYPELRRLVMKATGTTAQTPPSQPRQSGMDAEYGSLRDGVPSQTPDIHERFELPDCNIACKPDYVVGEND